MPRAYPDLGLTTSKAERGLEGRDLAGANHMPRRFQIGRISL